jgi:hypothetical protein
MKIKLAQIIYDQCRDAIRTAWDRPSRLYPTRVESDVGVGTPAGPTRVNVCLYIYCPLSTDQKSRARKILKTIMETIFKPACPHKRKEDDVVTHQDSTTTT